ncbi:hypothetical protein [Streptomyces nodosus]|uniref:Uncharacterized protein n=1 Tax=Streptomyces nodosus TaxID=40318 RepID=A0A0B5DGK8_9ACTN|nr:hypothetical protein [Streptomyces nodosus]AJE39132.1 hypothetical protein SNOD_03095 [Streptomyces nodosus]MBB4790009.1 hypothetical protein [Streptomyces nodosus]QEV37731.1 hypothetical protein CP978_03485 [Streptomyces nodosus]
MIAVVRGSTGEPVILLPGDPHQEVPEATLTDIIRAAAAVLSAAELRTVSRAITALATDQVDFCVAIGETVLTVYRLTAG